MSGSMAVANLWSSYQSRYADRLFGGGGYGGGRGSATSALSSMSGVLNDYEKLHNGDFKKKIDSFISDGKKNQETLSDKAATAKVNLTQAKTSADELKSAADALAANGAKSAFNQGGDAVVDAVKNFADKYNAVIVSSAKLDDVGSLGRTLSTIGLTNANKNMLSKVGITIGKDNQMTVNEDTLKKADNADLKALFNGSASYSSAVSNKAKSLSNDIAMASRISAGIYGKNGSFTSQAVSGLLFDGLF